MAKKEPLDPNMYLRALETADMLNAMYFGTYASKQAELEKLTGIERDKAREELRQLEGFIDDLHNLRRVLDEATRNRRRFSRKRS